MLADFLFPPARHRKHELIQALQAGLFFV